VLFHLLLKRLRLLDRVHSEAGHDAADLDQAPGAVFPLLLLQVLGEEALLSLQLLDSGLGLGKPLLDRLPCHRRDTS
jgi:hypothetical protein